MNAIIHMTPANIALSRVRTGNRHATRREMLVGFLSFSATVGMAGASREHFKTSIAEDRAWQDLRRCLSDEALIAMDWLDVQDMLVGCSVVPKTTCSVSYRLMMTPSQAVENGLESLEKTIRTTASSALHGLESSLVVLVVGSRSSMNLTLLRSLFSTTRSIGNSSTARLYGATFDDTMERGFRMTIIAARDPPALE